MINKIPTHHQEHHHEIFQKFFFGGVAALSAFLNVHADYKSMLTIKGACPGHSRRK